MLFHFQLRALADITPWGYRDTDPQADRQSSTQAVGQRPQPQIVSRFADSYEQPDVYFLHWFGLTDGWYWLQMNENDEFFRYSTDLLAHWEKNYPEDPTLLPYADYYVVRLWEDILELLPLILEPLPPKLAHMLETEEQVSRWRERIKQWEKVFGIEDEGEEEDREEDEEEEEIDEEMWETYLQATMWWHERLLDTGYLTASPHLWFWNDGHSIHGFWDNSQLYIENIPAWSAQRGQSQLIYAQFLDEVTSFHTRLFSAMEERIQEAKRSWPRPDVALDFDELEKEQQVRSQWLAQALERAASRAVTDWNAVVDAMRTMDRLSGFQLEEK
jgi:hypothetical protein